MSKLVKTVLGLGLGATAVGLGAGYATFRYAFLRFPEPDWSSEEAVRNSFYKDFCEATPAAVKWMERHEVHDVEVTSFDGLKLRGKWVPAEHPKATIILFHGYHSSWHIDFAAILSMYHSMDLNLLLVRQRTHGDSEGKYITFGVKERKDVLTWIDFHNRTHGVDNVFLGGLSMGASTVLFAAGEDLPPNVRAIVADCGFTCPREILSREFHKRFHLPAKPIFPFVAFWTKTLAGFDIDECDTRQILKRAKVPILFIHGTGDDFVPHYMSQQGHDACCTEKEIHLVEGAAHGMSYLKDPEGLTEALVAFLNRHLSEEYVRNE